MCDVTFICPCCGKENGDGSLYEMKLPFKYMCNYCGRDVIIDVRKASKLTLAQEHKLFGNPSLYSKLEDT